MEFEYTIKEITNGYLVTVNEDVDSTVPRNYEKTFFDNLDAALAFVAERLVELRTELCD